MPVSPAFAESNRSQTERLRRLVQRLDRAMLTVPLPNGWTVAGALAHVAFWDRLRLCLMRRWAAGDMCYPRVGFSHHSQAWILRASEPLRGKRPGQKTSP